MNRIKAKLVVCCIVLSLTTVVTLPVMAKGPNKKSGKSNMAHLYLIQKVKIAGEWIPVEGGKWGKMTYSLTKSEFEFVFNGHSFDANYEGVSFTLIYYPDPWPGNGLICLGSGNVERKPVLDGTGVPMPGVYTYSIHIANSVEIDTDLPIAADDNAYPSTTTYADGTTGAKIWLVLSTDVDCVN